MHCTTCDKQLQHCVCPDLGERIAAIEKSPYLHIAPEKLAMYKAQAERNLNRPLHQCQACGYETDGPHQLQERGGLYVCDTCYRTNPPIVPTNKERLTASLVHQALQELRGIRIHHGQRNLAHLSKAKELLESILGNDG